MIRNYFLINLLLLIVIGLLGFKSYKALTYPVDMPSKPIEGQVQTEKNVVARKDKHPDEAFFQIIAEKDIFRPSRTPSLENKEKRGGARQTFPQKSPRLFGTIIMNGERTALLEDPVTKATKKYKINDSVAGFVVTDIQKDKVILLRGDETVEVKLRESKGIKSRRSPLSRSPKSSRRAHQERQPKRPPKPSPPPSKR